jgi:serine/threonine protein kinase
MNKKKEYVYDDFILIKKLGSGSFGVVYLAIDKYDNKYALKIENKKKSTLKKEYKIYQKLHKYKKDLSIPKVTAYIETSKDNIMVMELLSHSLDYLFEKTNNFFKINTVLKLGIDIINIIKDIHDCGYIHRDVKPDNFMIGRDKKSLYIMDFGLSKKYIENNQHIKYTTERSLVGTARYTSIHVHNGEEPSRRDDLISIGYVLVYFLKGKLPWQGLKKNKLLGTIKKEENKILESIQIEKTKNKDSVNLIGNVKLYTKNSTLCENLPKCFEEYLEYCYKLKFEETPDYQYLISLFQDCSEKEKINLEYEWYKK